MVVVIAKALLNPSGLRSVCNHRHCRRALAGCSPLPSFFELWCGDRASRDQHALLLGRLQNIASSPSPEQVSVSQGWCRATGLSGPSYMCPCLASLLALWEAEGAFFRTLKWLLKVPLAAAQQWLVGQVEGSGSPK